MVNSGEEHHHLSALPQINSSRKQPHPLLPTPPPNPLPPNPSHLKLPSSLPPLHYVVGDFAFKELIGRLNDAGAKVPRYQCGKRFGMGFFDFI